MPRWGRQAIRSPYNPRKWSAQCEAQIRRFFLATNYELSIFYLLAAIRVSGQIRQWTDSQAAKVRLSTAQHLNLALD